MNNINWKSKVHRLIKAGERDETARLARKVLEEDYLNPQALGILANASRSHPEKYAALKCYTRFMGGKNIIEAQAMLQRYEEHPKIVAELQKNAPKWLENPENSFSLVDALNDYMDKEIPYPRKYSFDFDPLIEVERDWYYLQVSVQLIMKTIHALGLTLTVLWRFIRWIFSRITYLFSRKKPKRKKHN